MDNSKTVSSKKNNFVPDLRSFKFKSDKYRSVRGGQTAMIEIGCRCGEPMMIYQKDGFHKQHLYRLYLNRIFYPESLECLQKTARTVKDLPELICKKCGQKVGTPMDYKDGRLAFGLLMGCFYRKKIKNQEFFRK